MQINCWTKPEGKKPECKIVLSEGVVASMQKAQRTSRLLHIRRWLPITPISAGLYYWSPEELWLQK